MAYFRVSVRCFSVEITLHSPVWDLTAYVAQVSTEASPDWMVFSPVAKWQDGWMPLYGLNRLCL